MLHKACLCVFHHILVFGWGKWLGHNLLMPFSTLGSLKMEFFKPEFFNILTIHRDQKSYVKHVLSSTLGMQ